MKETKKLTIAGVLIAIGVIFSAFSIPFGFAKCFPVQHLINVIASVILGPIYAVTMAFVTSAIRFMMGTGTLLAFPGSMVGALCCGLLYGRTKKLWAAYLGEIVGTGILGALIAYPVAIFFMGKTVAIFAYVIPFSASTVVGAFVAVMIMKVLKTTGIMKKSIGEI